MSDQQSSPIPVTDHDTERRKKVVGLEDADIARIVPSRTW